MEGLLGAVADCLGLVIALCLKAVCVGRLSKPPSAKMRKKVENALYAKGLTLVDVSYEWDGGLGRPSRVVLVARAKDAFGNDRKQYFDAEVLADLVGLNARIHEIPSPKSAFG